MKQLTRVEFEKMTTNARVLSKDKHGLKVLESSNGKIFKLFRVKHTISSAHFRPYAVRFADNSEALQQHAVPTVKILDVFKVPEMKRDVVVYEPLPGKTLREQIISDAQNCFVKLPNFLAELHGKGIFFRSIHFGNIVVPSDGNFGLIDISDLQFRKWRGLWIWERVRNFKHLSKYKIDKSALTTFGVKKFIEAYLEASNVSGIRKSIWRKWITRALGG